MNILRDKDNFATANFEGPLDFLLQLIHKSEIDITEVQLQSIMEQYIQKLQEFVQPQLESGAEFIRSAASLHWLKSRKLLPLHENPEDIEEDLDPRFAIIHHLIDYCRFKEASKHLAAREQEQQAYYYRGGDSPWTPKKPLGIDHVTIEDLQLIFKDLMDKTPPPPGWISPEQWHVADKIDLIRDLLKNQREVDAMMLFRDTMGRQELIVTFLAILELMKQGEIILTKQNHSSQITIQSSCTLL